MGPSFVSRFETLPVRQGKHRVWQPGCGFPQAGTLFAPHMSHGQLKARVGPNEWAEVGYNENDNAWRTAAGSLERLVLSQGHFQHISNRSAVVLRHNCCYMAQPHCM